MFSVCSCCFRSLPWWVDGMCVELYAMILASQLAGVGSTAARLRKSRPRSRIVVPIVSIPSSIWLLGSISEGNSARMSFSGVLSLPSHFSPVNHT